MKGKTTNQLEATIIEKAFRGRLPETELDGRKW